MKPIVHVCACGGFFPILLATRLLSPQSKCTTAEELTNLSHEGQKVMDRLAACKRPLVAAINGACLGGGLEVALAWCVRGHLCVYLRARPCVCACVCGSCSLQHSLSFTMFMLVSGPQLLPHRDVLPQDGVGCA
ncbi:MAG: enoyl-CoA hydratase-related protein [Terracidiphilus sp.]|nr:enoyl-CoA hydratase-related protein [Terracidiphilus sp.]